MVWLDSRPLFARSVLHHPYIDGGDNGGPTALHSCNWRRDSAAYDDAPSCRLHIFLSQLFKRPGRLFFVQQSLWYDVPVFASEVESGGGFSRIREEAFAKKKEVKLLGIGL